MARLVVPPSVRIGFEALRSNPLRTALSTLGVIMGVASLVAVLSLGDGLERYARQQIEQTTSLQTVGVAPRLADELDGMTIPRSEWPVFTMTDAAALQQLVGSRGAVSITTQGRTVVTRTAADSARGAMLVAADSVTVARRDVTLAAGRLFGDAEAARGDRMVVLGDRLARALVPGGDPASLVGDTVRLRGQAFEVVGVLAPPPMEEPFNFAIVPFAAAEDVLVPTFGRPAVPTLVTHLARVELADSMRGEIQRWATARWGDSVEIQAGAKTRLAQVRTGMIVFRLAMGSFAAIAIIVGGIGIMNVLLASVFERTREIGVRKAIGARNRDILAQFLAESVSITGAGSLLGAVLGVAGAFTAAAVMRAQTDAPVYAAVTIPTVVIASVVALVSGLAFGSYPAIRAARLSPIEAIRHE